MHMVLALVWLEDTEKQNDTFLHKTLLVSGYGWSVVPYDNKLDTLPAYHSMAQLQFLELTVTTSTTLDNIV